MNFYNIEVVEDLYEYISINNVKNIDTYRYFFLSGHIKIIIIIKKPSLLRVVHKCLLIF